MPEMLELIENLREEEASVSRLFGGEGQKVRERRSDPQRLVETAKFLNEVWSGKRPIAHLKEAMSTSDFPVMFADILDRQTLGFFQETTPTWQAYCGRTVVPDFRNVKRTALDGSENALPEVDELEEYPESSLEERQDEFKVRKYGRRIDLSWEAWINDDLDQFRRMPERLARGARRSEARTATGLFVDTKGPHASLYKAEFKNIVEGNPELSIEGLQKALTQLSKMTDFDGEPIEMDMITLVVPPALQVVAENILNATAIRLTKEGGTEGRELEAANWMRSRFNLQVEPYIPVIASKEHGDTSWFLFATPSTGRPAITLGFLRGYETPGLYERIPNARRVGGGGGEVVESYEDDSRSWKIRHVLGGARLTNTGGYKATIASNGSKS